MRKRWFYWRVVYAYRLGMQNDFLNRKWVGRGRSHMVPACTRVRARKR